MKPHKVEKWKLSRLTPHALQASIFGDLPDNELDALAADMKANGQQEPIEILPDSTIICGHQRARAARKLKWKVIDVIVRHDLVVAGEAAIEAYFVNSNLLRRQLSPLGRARCIRRLMEIEIGDSADTLAWGEREALKARIATAMGLSPRSINRYLLILQTPIEVQDAFDRGALGITDAGSVSYLTEAEKGQIASRIAAGEAPKQVVRSMVSRPSDRRTRQQAFQRLYRALAREMAELNGHVDHLDTRFMQDDLPLLLSQAREFCDALIERLGGEEAA